MVQTRTKSRRDTGGRLRASTAGGNGQAAAIIVPLLNACSATAMPQRKPDVSRGMQEGNWSAAPECRNPGAARMNWAANYFFSDIM
jgi:hypothetical protein